jgi:hypothetical protein
MFFLGFTRRGKTLASFLAENFPIQATIEILFTGKVDESGFW